MPFHPTTYRVLIAAPGDLHEEIEIAERVMHRFRLTVGDDVIRLEPLHWKKDSRPDIQMEPQDAINEQLVDDGDMILAMFWTRRGTKTRREESGTEEEIERFRTGGRPGMVYFSNRVVADTTPPAAKELLRRARERSRIEKLKAKYQGRDATHTPMFTGEFSTTHEFEIMLARHLDGMVRDHHQAEKANLTPTLVVEDVRAAEVKANAARDEFDAEVSADRFREFEAKQDILAVCVFPATPIDPPLVFTHPAQMRVKIGVPPLGFHNASPSIELFGEHALMKWPYAAEYPMGKAPRSISIAELTDVGTIRTAWDMDWNSHGFSAVERAVKPHNFRMTVYQSRLIAAVQLYLTFLREVGVHGTIFVGLSILKPSQMSKLVIRDQPTPFDSEHGRFLGGHNLRPRLVVVRGDADVSTFAAVADVLHPALRHIWHAAGYQVVPVYDEQGTFLRHRVD